MDDAERIKHMAEIEEIKARNLKLQTEHRYFGFVVGGGMVLALATFFKAFFQ